MSGHKSRRSRSKRRQVEGHGDDEEIIDDLAYAATFAMMGPPVTSPTVRKNDDENEGDEIEIDEKESEAEEENDHAETETVQSPPKEYSKAAEKEHDEDDDDVELNIAEMEDEMEEELVDGKNKPNTNHAPKTEHEVDAYKTPIQELEQHLQFSLTVDQGSTKTSRSMNSANLILAGTIKHFMINDRTVVVESNPPVNGSSLTPLDEGSLLVLKHRENLIPLGRIFEVFGPVSQPLYTIRLPAPTSVITNPKTAATPKERQDKKYLQGESTEEPERDQISPGPENYDDVGDTKDLNNTMKTPADSQIDHWAPDGKYSLLLKSNDAISVCFVQDEAKLIDTTFILRSSGKGCDASDVYDEEVANTDEMYYSDDEKERQAKGRRRGGKKGQHQQQGRNRIAKQGVRGPAVVPRGFHQSVPPAGFHNPPPPSSRLPQGFCNPATSTQPQAYPYGYPNPARTSTGGGAIPPPPPPQRENAPNQPPTYPTGPPAYQY